MDGTLGGKYTADELADTIDMLWPAERNNKYVVCTGGEPMLQLDSQLIDAFHAKHFEVGVETNGTITPPPGLDSVSYTHLDVYKRQVQERIQMLLPMPMGAFLLR